ncbi:MAG: helix-turn-helix domain-containing protein, partial [Betaproteobacteria bacterium]
RAQGNQSQAAQWLGINRNTLRRKLLEHGLASS